MFAPEHVQQLVKGHLTQGSRRCWCGGQNFPVVVKNSQRRQFDWSQEKKSLVSSDAARAPGGQPQRRQSPRTALCDALLSTLHAGGVQGTSRQATTARALTAGWRCPRPRQRGMLLMAARPAGACQGGGRAHGDEEGAAEEEQQHGATQWPTTHLCRSVNDLHHLVVPRAA